MRELLLEHAARTEGGRLLRAMLGRRPAAWVARKLGCDAASVRRWARETCKPSLPLRRRAKEEFDWSPAAWDEPAQRDVYASEPDTRRSTR